MPTNKKRKPFISQRAQNLAKANLSSDTKVGNINKITEEEIRSKTGRGSAVTGFSGGISGEAGRRAGAGGVQVEQRTTERLPDSVAASSGQNTELSSVADPNSGEVPDVSQSQSTLQDELDTQATKLRRKLEAKQRKEKERQDALLTNQDAIEKGQLRAAGLQGEAAIASTTAQFAQGREGVFSTGTTQIASEFGTRVSEEQDRAGRRLINAQIQRQSLREQLEEAQKTESVQLELNIIDRIAAIDNQISQGEIDASNNAAAATKEAFSFLKSSTPGSLADLSVQDISAGFGVTPIVANTLKNLDQKKAELQTSDPDFILKQAQIKKAESEALWAGMTNDQRNFVTLQSITDPKQRATFEKLIGVNPDLRTFKVGEDAYSFDPATNKTTKIVDSSKTNDVIPTGEFITQEVAGRKVTLDSAAMVAFMQANEAMVGSGLGELKIGGQDTSSFRSQAATIASVAQRKGIGFNAANPNETAQELRNMGVAIANVGGSKHESGLAIDIFPNEDYISKIKPVLEANGWKQTIPVGDAGHFEFVGITSPFSSKAKNLSKQIDRGELKYETLLEENPALAFEVAGIRAGNPLTKKEKQSKLGESQANSWSFANRLKISESILTEFDDTFFKVGNLNPLRIIGAIPFVDTPNALLSGDQQRFDQAKRNFITAVLRKESGAAIAESEFEVADLQYFRQTGDGEAVIKQKAKLRNSVTALMLQGSGRNEFEDGVSIDEFKAGINSVDQVVINEENSPTLTKFNFTERSDIDDIIDNN